MPNPVPAAAEGMPKSDPITAAAAKPTISRRSFLATSAAGSVLIAAGTVAGTAATATGLARLSALIKRHKHAAAAFDVAGKQFDQVDAAFRAGPITYQTSAGLLTLYKERLTEFPEVGLVPAAIVTARAARHLTEPFTREEARAFSAASKATFEADVAAYMEAIEESKRRQIACGVTAASLALNNAHAAEYDLWEQLLAFPCAEVDEIRAKVAYVLASPPLMDRLLGEDDDPGAEMCNLLRSLCGASGEPA